MNRKHVSKVGKCISVACLLFACAAVQSCRDEYYFDDTKPDILGPSIYEYLKDAGYTHFKKVIDDLDYDEVLARTGSKTLFVADDQAFMAGIDKAWGVKDTADLTLAQKRIILNSAMLDNAYLLEMLSKMQSVGANAEPIPGQCLRRETSASIADTIGLFFYEDLPKNNPDWDIFNPESKIYKGEPGVRLALDATSSLLLHLTSDYMYQEAVDESDLKKITGRESASMDDMYIYDKKVIKGKSDITCKNGYVHQLDGLLIPPLNMAEELRKNGEEAEEVFARSSVNVDDLDSTTFIFSRMLDRFAVPVPIDKDSKIAETYYLRYPERSGEQLYEKKYYVEGKLESYKDANEVPHAAVGTLLFNPGWNAYESDGTAKERDMAAIFAPSDKALIHYFTEEESGMLLLDRYGKDFVDGYNDVNKGLLESIDRIPLDVLEPLVRNHMQVSFVNTVPTKFDNIVDDARDAIGVDVNDVEKTILANNGIVYVMNKAFRPARFASVIAPVMLDDTLYVFNKMIGEEGYDSYLLAMKSKFSLLVASNKDMVYYDPYTERSRANRDFYQLLRQPVKDPTTGVINWEVKAQKYSQEYNSKTGLYGDTIPPKLNEYVNSKKYYKEILEYNIVLGDMNAKDDCDKGRKYYESKGFGSVKVLRGADGTGPVTAVAGGRQLRQGTAIPLAAVDGSIPNENGWTLRLDGALVQPSIQSVRDVMLDTLYNEYCFHRFFEDLCTPNQTVLSEILGPRDDKNAKEWDKFLVFSTDDNRVVTMFNMFNYTVYVPTAEALEKAYAQGLKTWAQLAEECLEIQALKSDDPTKAVRKAQLKADANLISKFVRYHFQTGSVFVDNIPHSVKTSAGGGKFDEDLEVQYKTAAMNDSTLKLSRVLVQTDNNTLAVCGDFGEGENAKVSECKNVCRVINTDPAAENKKFNVMTRDIVFSSREISKSSYAVVHLIDNFLVYGGKGGIYEYDENGEGHFITYLETEKKK